MPCRGFLSLSKNYKSAFSVFLITAERHIPLTPRHLQSIKTFLFKLSEHENATWMKNQGYSMKQHLAKLYEFS